jgi:hypothetical protein
MASNVRIMNAHSDDGFNRRINCQRESCLFHGNSLQFAAKRENKKFARAACIAAALKSIADVNADSECRHRGSNTPPTFGGVLLSASTGGQWSR